MPISRAARATRTAISPRLAIKSRRITRRVRFAAFQERAQAFLAFGAGPLARDRVARKRQRRIVIGIAHVHDQLFRGGDRRRTRAQQLAYHAFDFDVELRDRDDPVHETDLFGAVRVEAFPGEKIRARLRAPDFR